MTTFLQDFVLQFSFSYAAMYFEEQASVNYDFYKTKAGSNKWPRFSPRTVKYSGHGVPVGKPRFASMSQQP